LPFADLVQHSVGDAADQVRRDLQTIKVKQVGLDVAYRQPSGVEPNDLVVHPVDPGLALLHQLRLEAAVPVPRDRHWQFPVLPLQHLGRCAVAAIGLARRRVLALFIAQMRGQLRTQHPFHELDLQLFHQPGVAKQIFRALNPLQQFVQQFLGERMLTSRIHRRKPVGRPMPRHTARANARKSSIRAAVEHVFAHQKTRFGLFIRTIGLARAEAKLTLANIAYNFDRLIFHERRCATG